MVPPRSMRLKFVSVQPALIPGEDGNNEANNLLIIIEL
jgi:hypothetical protein